MTERREKERLRKLMLYRPTGTKMTFEILLDKDQNGSIGLTGNFVDSLIIFIIIITTTTTTKIL
jgi:hypothetical protein